jgi:tetratricopeptide (TPR) repeat protein
VANARAYYGQLLAIMGRTDEAIQQTRRALELDPFNALFHGAYAWVLTYQRRFDEAIAAARAALAIDPNSEIGRNNLQRAFIVKGMRAEQLALQRQLIASDPELVATLEHGLAEGGYAVAQRRLGDVLATRYEKARGVPNGGASRVYAPIWIALRYIDAGDYSRAVDWLETAYTVHDPNLIYIGQPLYDPLRADPRFQALLRRVGLPQ